MTDERTRAVLRLIADHASRDALHGQSLRALKKRGLIRAQYSGLGLGLEVKHYLTQAGRDFLSSVGKQQHD